MWGHRNADCAVLGSSMPPNSLTVGLGSPPAYAFDDEFTGDLSLWTDHDSWQEPPGYWMEDMVQWGPLPASDYGLAVVANGVLSLKTLFLNHPNGAAICGVELNTRNTFATFVHGSIDGRFQIPGNPQAWPAFWLLGDGNWPGSGEIDIFEFVNNGSQNGIPFFSVHWASATAGDDARTWADAASWTHRGTAPVPNYTTGWHTWHVERTSDYIKVWIDDTLWAQVSRSDLAPIGGNFDVIFNAPMHIRLTMSSGANAVGNLAYDPKYAAAEGICKIDYIRVSATP
jgi:hypothetical protein